MNTGVGQLIFGTFAAVVSGVAGAFLLFYGVSMLIKNRKSSSGNSAVAVFLLFLGVLFMACFVGCAGMAISQRFV